MSSEMRAVHVRLILHNNIKDYVSNQRGSWYQEPQYEKYAASDW